ncbi:Uncharacterised protein [Proteus mirabilis]|nr:Uncharacterised protein [Proteus mirabilis]
MIFVGKMGLVVRLIISMDYLRFASTESVFWGVAYINPASEKPVPK